MNKSNLMSKAHKIAKTLIGNYAARLSMALKMVWNEIKKGVNNMAEMVGTEKQVKYAQDLKETVKLAAEKILEKMANKNLDHNHPMVVEFVEYIKYVNSSVQELEDASIVINSCKCVTPTNKGGVNNGVLEFTQLVTISYKEMISNLVSKNLLKENKMVEKVLLKM